MQVSRFMLTALAAVLAAATPAAAQLVPPNRPGWTPLNQHMPPGWNAELLVRAGVADPSWMQPVRVELPSERARFSCIQASHSQYLPATRPPSSQSA